MNQTSTRGRKRIAFTFPACEFKVKELAAQRNVSVPFIHLRMKEAGDKIVNVRSEKLAGQKGRPATIYKYTGCDYSPSGNHVVPREICQYCEEDIVNSPVDSPETPVTVI